MTSLNAEDWTIAAIAARVPHPPSPAGPGDDAAIVTAAGGVVALTTDLLIEETHFLAAHPPEALGWKSLMVNLSDVAAMGAVATGFCLGLGLPRRWPGSLRRRWVEGFADGLGAAARQADVMLVGGDTVRADAGVVIAITAWGSTGARLLRRDAARPGDEVWVLGRVGRAGEGLRRWLADARTRSASLEAGEVPPTWEAAAATALLADPCLRAHLRPEPALTAGKSAAERGATAAMDLSDGLARDLPRLAEASAVTLAIDLARLPDDLTLRQLTPAARATGGEDYGLLVTAPVSCHAAIAELGFTAIGTVGPRDADGVLVRWSCNGAAIAPPCPDFEHF